MNDPSAILERLLTDRTYRDDFIAGRLVDLPPAFATVDPVQLERTAVRLREDLMHRQFRGSGGIQSLYARTLAAAREPLDDLFARFIASPQYRLYREWPRTPDGQCLEEAFYRFAEASDLGDPATREGEFLHAVIRAVLLSPDPSFTLPVELLGGPRATFAITTRSATPQLFAATPDGLVQGALTAFLADLLHLGADVARARHVVPPHVVDAAVARFSALGLL